MCNLSRHLLLLQIFRSASVLTCVIPPARTSNFRVLTAQQVPFQKAMDELELVAVLSEAETLAIDASEKEDVNFAKRALDLLLSAATSLSSSPGNSSDRPVICCDTLVSNIHATHTLHGGLRPADDCKLCLCQTGSRVIAVPCLFRQDAYLSMRTGALHADLNQFQEAMLQTSRCLVIHEPLTWR